MTYRGCDFGYISSTKDQSIIVNNERIESRQCSFSNYVVYGPGKNFLIISFLVLLIVFFGLRIGDNKTILSDSPTQKQFNENYSQTLSLILACIGVWAVGFWLKKFTIYGMYPSGQNGVNIPVTAIIATIGFFVFVKYNWKSLFLNKGKVTVLISLLFLLILISRYF